MKKERRFRCLSPNYGYYHKGSVYEENICYGTHTVVNLATKFPSDWQEVFDNEEQKESIGDKLIKLGELTNKREELTHTVDETDDSVDELLTEMKTFFNNFK